MAATERTDEVLCMNELKRLAKRGSILRLSQDLKDAVQDDMHDFLCRVFYRSTMYARVCKRKTITRDDMKMALRGEDMDVWGFK